MSLATNNGQPVTAAEHLQEVHSVRFTYFILSAGIFYLVATTPGFAYFHRHWWLVAANLLAVCIMLPMYLYLYRTKQSERVLWVLCAMSVLANVPVVIDGGIANTATNFAIGGLIVIFLLKGTAGLKFWLATEYVALVVAFVLSLFHIVQLPYTTTGFVVFLSGILFELFMLLFYGNIKENLERQLTESTKQLELAKNDVERQVRERTSELHEARAYLIASINSLEQGFILVNAESHIELANGAAQKLWTPADVSQPSAVVLAATVQIGWDIDLAKLVANVLTTHEAQNADISTKTGSFYVVYVTPVIEDSLTLGATIVIEDVTEQKILDRSKDEFFSIASHELRTPLTAIRGNMSMAMDYYPAVKKDKDLHSLIDDSHAASTRLIEMVNDFLDSSSLEQGKMVFNLTAVSLEPLVRSVVTDLKPLTHAQHNKIVVKGLKDLPSMSADERRLRQILYNLLSNANKYSQKATITVSAVASDGTMHISVADTGKGIDPEHQKLLFRKFQQAGDPLTRDNTKGTGLGLYIAKLLAKQMHGDVVLEYSEPNKGSTFSVVLPLHP